MSLSLASERERPCGLEVRNRAVRVREVAGGTSDPGATVALRGRAMFRGKRADTMVSTIEKTYSVNFNVRSDALLGNLLEDRGFDSLSQLLDAYHGRAAQHA